MVHKQFVTICCTLPPEHSPLHVPCRNCAFKNATTGLPLFYPGFIPGRYVLQP
jgi:hypothetical protein